ncbi:hypothetical protein [Lactococcus lactis]|uniref:Uncharacterized protein n=1 Tax=Lactococcus lactis subsp. lactis TaxID=1360 RepID=A0A2N5WB36_LACLL|nr:hypothetical protein [Lactococcus lactis]PLW59457.1 hypothetical protein CYU10_000320 [Lactococcus lactis subsp. lactis]
MSNFNQDMENLLHAYDSNWQDYLILREQFIEKYKLSVEKLQEQLNTAKKALTEIQQLKRRDTTNLGMINKLQTIAKDTLAAIGGDDEC